VIDFILTSVNWDAVFGAIGGAAVVMFTLAFDKVLAWIKSSKTDLDNKAIVAVVQALVDKGVVKDAVLTKVKTELGVE